MKKVVFTAILLIGLGGVWTLYLEHSNKRFADNLRKGTDATQQRVSLSEAPAVGEKNNQAARVDSVPTEITAENAQVQHEHARPQAHPHMNTPDTQNAQVGALAEENRAQTSSDSNPVPPEVIADSKRDLEWWRALKEWQAKDKALSAEWYELDQEFDKLISFSLEEVQRMGDKEKTALRVKANDLKAKSEAWDKKKAELDKEKPVRPTPTHTH
jgi:hypothetical protein